MSEYDFDLFVIGAGSGGVRAARIAAGYGARVGICEDSRVGGTCVIRGCVPKKLMVYASHFADEIEDAAGYGWDIPSATFDWQRFIAAKDVEIDRLNAVYIDLLEASGVQLYLARGKFLDDHRILLTDKTGRNETISAETILIATGGRPWVPEVSGAEYAITSNEAFHLPALPQRIAVVGGGYIACEFAGIFNGMGSAVTQIYRGDALLRGFDHDVRRFVGAELQGKGITLMLESDVIRIEKGPDGLNLHFKEGKQVQVDTVMYATGRVPHVRNLGIKNTDVEVRADGSIVVDEYSKTSVGNIYAVGDVTHRINLTPVAINEGHAFADILFGGKPRPVNHEFVPSAVFSQPPIGTVGFSEEDARRHFGDVEIFRSEFRPMKHTLSGRNEYMLMKLIVASESQRVVGMHLVGMDAPEIVLGFAVAVKSGLTKEQFDCTIGIHPTAAEELVTMRTAVVESTQG